MIRQAEFLILIADCDQSDCTLLSDFFTQKNVKSAIARDASQTFEMAEFLKPDCIIIDTDLPGFDLFSFLRQIKTKNVSSSIVITSRKPDLKTAVEAIKCGAIDYVAKPVVPQDILECVKSKAIQSSDKQSFPSRNDADLLYDVISRITATHDIETLFSLTIDSGCSLTSAQSAVLYLYDQENNELVNIRESGKCNHEKRLLIPSEFDDSSIVISVYKHKIPFVKTVNNVYTSDIDKNVGTWKEIAVPINVSGETTGVLWLSEKCNEAFFLLSDLNVIDIIASQSGIALYNANLYTSINQKLEELLLVSNYSEQLMGLVDKNDVIRILYETAIKHFPFDIMGFLVIQKRTYEFLYWTRTSVDEKCIQNVCADVVEHLKSSTLMSINESRIKYRRITIGESPGDAINDLSLNFKHIIPVSWEDFKFGAFFFGATKPVADKTDVVTLLSSLVNQTRIALANSKLYNDIKENYIRTIKALAIAVDAKDTYTHGHSENVMNIAEQIARAMNFDEKTVGIIRDAGLLHDIGKIGIPGNILNKPGPLTYEEFNGIMKTHSTLGANIVRDVPFLKELYKLILYHHERFDGNGYPDGIKGEQIPIGARIIHVADAFEAMTSNRPYRNSLGETEAVKRLIEGKSSQFDPEIINVFLKIVRKKYKIKE